MPCTKCKSDFNLLTWKLKCFECEFSYCSKCLKRNNGTFFCDKCAVLNKRPPEREKLMELKSKDIQDYLRKRNISTYGFVEKREIVDLFYKTVIPPHQGRRVSPLSSVLGSSVPNLVSHTEETLNKVASNLETNLNNIRDYAEAAYSNLIQPNNSGGSNLNNNNNNTNIPAAAATSTTSNTTSNMNGSQRRSENETSNSTAASNSQTATTNIAKQQDTNTNDLQKLKLSEIKSIEEIENLSAKQLKQLLALNRVDFRGVVEKNELLEKVIALWIESHNITCDGDSAPKDDEDSCKICMDAPLECVILECGHIATCVECGKQLSECPICRQYVSRVVRTFKA